MKLKKIKNYILTFIICLLGAFAFNSIETKASTIPDMTAQFHYNDSIIYVNEGGKQYDSNGVEISHDAYETTLTLVNFNGKYMLIWNDFIRDRLINFRQCTLTRYNGGFSGEFIFGEFNCTSIMDVFNNTTNSTNNNYSRKFYLMSSGDTNTMYDIDKLYIRMQFDSGEYRNFYQDTALYGEGYNAGYEDGYNEGYTEGYKDGVSSTDAYQEGYQAGYEAGYSENNTIPTIYLENSNMIYSTSAGSISVPINNYISGIGGKLDFTALLNFNFPVIATNPQRVIISLKLLTPLSVDDELEFAFAAGTEYYSIIFSDVTNGNVDITNSVSLSYNDIITNDNKIILSEINPNLTIDNIDTIVIMADYENGILYGATTITDNTLSANIDENYQIGYNVGYIAGEQAGINTGRTEGYNLGYNAGLDFAFTNENTITGLVGTLFTMPVNMFKSIFDFEFLGINLTAFFLSLITLLVVIWLIKKFI